MFWVWDIHYSVFFFLISWNVVNNFLTNILLVIYKDNSDQTDQLTNRTLNHWKFNCCCSVAQTHWTLCDPLDCRTPGFPDLHHLLKLAQTHVHQFADAIQPFHPLTSPSPFAFNLFHHQALYQWVGSCHQVAKVLELQLQHQAFQWTFRTDFL